MQNSDFSIASSSAIVAALGQQLDAIRLSRNLSQATLATEAGVSRSTISRLADGKGLSLDSFVRIVQALKLEDNLAALLPDPGVRPIERLKFDGKKRQRASSKRKPYDEWQWGDQGGSE